MLQELEVPEEVSKSGRHLLKLILWVIGYIITSILVNIHLPNFLGAFKETYQEYLPYLNIGLIFAFGYFMITAFSNLMYWNLRLKYPHSTAQVVRNVIKLIGVGALIALVAGGSAGGAAGVALGGFVGMVVGFATQKVLGQAIAGLFLLVMRPFKIGDKISVAGEEGTVKNVTTFFTILEKDDGDLALIPNNNVIGGKINIKKPETNKSERSQSSSK